MNIFDTKIFLTTTLPYVNSNPHIGHAFEFILADAISRYLKDKSKVHFNIGLDEHGLKFHLYVRRNRR
jgi:methionyl-tRNA synthetase